MRSTPGCIFLLPLKSRIAEVIARPTLHPGVGHIHRNAIAIAALDPRTIAQRHLNVPLLAAGGYTTRKSPGCTSDGEMLTRSAAFR